MNTNDINSESNKISTDNNNEINNNDIEQQQDNDEEEYEDEEYSIYYDGLQDSKYYTLSNDPYENKQNNNKISSTVIPLKSEDLQSIRINGLHILPWKLNLMAVSYNSKYIFTAESDIINVRNIDNPNIIIRTITLDTMEMTINQIRLGILDGEEVLISVDEGGFVRIIFVNEFDRDPIRLYNSGISTWGIAICASKPLLAVSSNSHKITIWNMNDENPQQSKIVLPKHKHNIPSIDFSPCGNYLVSVCIDKNIRIWDVNKKQLLRIATLAQWCWACRWIDLTSRPDQIPIHFRNKEKHLIEKSWRGLNQHEEQQLVQQNVEVEPIPEDEIEEIHVDDNGGNEEEAEEEAEEEEDIMVDNENQGDDEELEDLEYINELEPIQEVENEGQEITYNDLYNAGDEEEEEEEDEEELTNTTTTITTTTTTTTTTAETTTTPNHQQQQQLENSKINSKLIVDKDKLPSHVVFSTYQNLYLSQIELDKLMVLSNAIPTSFPIIQTQIDRIAFLEVVPELSLVIAASQGPARLVSLYRIIKQTPIKENTSGSNDGDGDGDGSDGENNESESSTEINMFLESVLSPPSGGPGLIVGLSVVKNHVENNPAAFSINLYILYINGIFINFHIKRSTLQSKPTYQNSVFFDQNNSKNHLFGLDISSFGL